MPATKESMLQEFATVVYKDDWETSRGPFPAPKNAKYVSDLAVIGSFLHPENALFCEALEKLDAAMIKLFETRTRTSFDKTTAPLLDFSYGRAIQRTDSQGGDATKHLLSKVLAAHEVTEDFKGIESETGKCVCFYNNLDSGDFGGAIKSMHLAKDYVGSEHGAYTHRIQWYCAGIMKNDLALQNKVMSSTFKSSGRVWGIVFDRNAREGISLLEDDFRRPEIMNPWIANNDRKGSHSWPVLSAYLKSRFARMSERGWSSHVLRINLAAKLFPAKARPTVNYRRQTQRENELLLESFGLTEEEMALVNKAAGGVAFDGKDRSLVNFRGGIKNEGPGQKPLRVNRVRPLLS